MKTGSKIALALGAVAAFLFAKKKQTVSGIGAVDWDHAAYIAQNDLGIDLNKSFFELTWSQIDDLVLLAKRVGYRRSYDNGKSYGRAFYDALKRKKISGVEGTTGARIVDKIELFSNCDSAEEIKKLIEDYIEDNLGHVVEDQREAYEYFKNIYRDGLDYGDVQLGNSQYSNFYLDKEDEYGFSPLIRVVIDEIIVDPESDHYCYIVTVEED